MYQRTTFLNIAWHFWCRFDCHSIALLALSYLAYGYAYGYSTQDQVQVAMFYSIGIGIAQGAQAYASPPTTATTFFLQGHDTLSVKNMFYYNKIVRPICFQFSLQIYRTK